jgi:hypothetical protein
MKYVFLLSAGAALALAACQQSETPAAEATETAAPATEPAAAAAAPASPAAFTAGQPPSKEFMAGTWGEGDACELPITFAADGTITDGPFDSWTIENGELVMGGEVRLKVTVVDADTMKSQPQGSSETNTLKRCS